MELASDSDSRWRAAWMSHRQSASASRFGFSCLRTAKSTFSLQRVNDLWRTIQSSRILYNIQSNLLIDFMQGALERSALDNRH